MIPTTGGALVGTADSGQTWQGRSAPAGNLQTVCFIDASQGWAGTAEGAVCRTTNGGTSWVKVLQRPGVEPGLPQATLIECAAPHSLWVLFEGGSAAAGHVPYVAYATADGTSWRAVLEESMTGGVPGIPAGPDSHPGSFSVIDPSNAAFVGDEPVTGRAPVVLAGSGGSALTRTGSIPDSPETAAAAFVSRSNGWVIAREGATGQWTIQATTNGGYNWTGQYTVAG